MEEIRKNEIQDGGFKLENTEKLEENKENKENKENLEQLKKDKEDAEKKVDELEQILKSLELDISNLQKQIPEIDGKYVDREYKNFTDGLGQNFKKKLEVLVSMQKDISNDFINGNLADKDKENLSKLITCMQSLIDDLKRSETGNENYDNQQFVKLTRGSFDMMISTYKGLNYIKKYSGSIDKYLDEKNGLNQYKAKIDSDPKNVEINKQISELGQVYQEKLKEKHAVQVKKDYIDDKIKGIE